MTVSSFENKFSVAFFLLCFSRQEMNGCVNTAKECTRGSPRLELFSVVVCMCINGLQLAGEDALLSESVHIARELTKGPPSLFGCRQ